MTVRKAKSSCFPRNQTEYTHRAHHKPGVIADFSIDRPQLETSNLPWNRILNIIFKNFAQYAWLLKKLSFQAYCRKLKLIWHYWHYYFTMFTIGTYTVQTNFSEFSCWKLQIRTLETNFSTFPCRKLLSSWVLITVELLLETSTRILRL